MIYESLVVEWYQGMSIIAGLKITNVGTAATHKSPVYLYNVKIIFEIQFLPVFSQWSSHVSWNFISVILKNKILILHGVHVPYLEQ